MFGHQNKLRSVLMLTAVLLFPAGYAVAETDDSNTTDSDRPARRHLDGEGRRHWADHDGGRRHRHQDGDSDEAGDRGRRSGQGDADGRRPHGRRDHGAMARRLFAGMDLTDEQKTAVREAMKAHGDERKAWHEAHQDEFQDLREQMRDARGDQEAMKAVREQMHALMESAPKPDATHDTIRSLLNDEQQVIFDERIEKMRERREQWRENRKDGPNRGRGLGRDGEGPPSDADRQGRRGRPGGRLFRGLDLDDDQKAQMREIMQSDKTRDQKKAAVREVLTDEQKAKFDKRIEKMREYREKHHGKRGDRGDRPRRGQQGNDPPNDGDEGGDET